MKYATWKLNFDNPDYGTGPEEKIAELGAKAEAGWTDGAVENGGTVLGYLDAEVEAGELSIWNFAYITQEQALNFCLAIDPDAYLNNEGKIAAPLKDIINNN
jgi:hypothetical protein